MSIKVLFGEKKNRNFHINLFLPNIVAWQNETTNSWESISGKRRKEISYIGNLEDSTNTPIYQNWVEVSIGFTKIGWKFIFWFTKNGRKLLWFYQKWVEVRKTADGEGMAKIVGLFTKNERKFTCSTENLPKMRGSLMEKGKRETLPKLRGSLFYIHIYRIYRLTTTN